MRDNDRGSRRFHRRDLMKLGAGIVTSAFAAERLSAQRSGGRGDVAQAPVPPPGSPPPTGWRPHTGPGYTYTANRLGANGPMDDTTAKIVKFVHGYKESDMTPTVVRAVNRTMVDSMAAMIAGFEE